MHILSIFPSFLTYSLVAPLLLRISAGAFLIFKAKERYGKPYKWLSVIYFITGALLVVGLYTQVSALVGFFIMGFDDWADKKVSPPSLDSVLLHTIFAIIFISLIFTGPGFFAIDLPL